MGKTKKTWADLTPRQRAQRAVVDKDGPWLTLRDAAGKKRAVLGVGAGESALVRLTANWHSVVESISGMLFGQKNNGR
ncbi:MAG: hypothetical protein WBC53_02750 [Phycisphaerae bacterium]